MNDHELMRRCFELARLGEYTVRPNPMVGAVLVTPEGEHFEGWHARYGEAHAEVNALNRAGQKARDGTLYVSLEPCHHQGKTGPCSQRVINSGIRRLVYGMEDPNPQVAGRGLAAIEAAGIEVSGPVLKAEAEALNPGFISRMRRQRPYVRIKLGMSLDGRTAMASGESQWITGPEAREDVQRWRARSDAILTGIGTVLADRPSLNVRLQLHGLRQPIRVIVDSQLQTPLDAPIVTLPGRVLIATALPAERLQEFTSQFAAHEASLLSLPDSQGKVDLLALLKYLSAREECGTVLVEAGAVLAGALVASQLADELLIYAAPTLLGSGARPLLALPGIERMAEQRRLDLVDVALVGKDCRMRSLIL